MENNAAFEASKQLEAAQDLFVQHHIKKEYFS